MFNSVGEIHKKVHVKHASTTRFNILFFLEAEKERERLPIFWFTNQMPTVVETGLHKPKSRQFQLYLPQEWQEAYYLYPCLPGCTMARSQT